MRTEFNQKTDIKDTVIRNLNPSFFIIFSILTAALASTAIFSLRWRIQHDSPIMFYIGFLIDRFDFVPYRDIFDMNMPFSYFLFYLIGNLTNYNDLGIRIVDIILLFCIMISTWFWLRNLDWKVAWFASITFGLVYLFLGPVYTLQREYFIILLFSLSMLFTESFYFVDNRLRLVCVGFLGGLSFLIKPHSLVFFIAIAIYQLLKIKTNNLCTIRSVSLCLLGFIFPNIIVLIYLIQNGALSYFLDILKNYLPLYGGLTGAHETIYGIQRLKYLVTQYFRIDDLKIWIVPALIGVFTNLRDQNLNKQKRNLVVFIGLLVFIGTIYPVFSGQFWRYHYFLFIYFAIIAGSLSLAEFNKTKVVPVIILFAFVFLQLTLYFPNLLSYDDIQPKNGNVDKISSLLKNIVHEGETVQPLDWTGGAVHGLLQAKVPIATPFIYDFHFYHHISNPYIQNLRQKFISSLKTSKPKYIVRITSERKPWVSGEDTTRTFKNLEYILKNEYKPLVHEDDFDIYIRKR